MNESTSELSACDGDSDMKPRSYQEQLLECALRQNSIIYLPTGSGKTFIAIMVLKHMSKSLIGSFKGGSAKRSIFICNTVALVNQQCEVLKKTTNLKCSAYTGDQNVDNWKRDKWEEEFENCQVVVATCQIVVDVIRHKHLSLNQINLIIVDECHHATGGHPMHQLMALFQSADQTRLPHVVGLTGILLKTSKKENIIRDLNALEAVYRAKIITVANMGEYHNVLMHSTKAEEVAIKYQSSLPSGLQLSVQEKVKTIIKECIGLIGTWKVDGSHFKASKNLGSMSAPRPMKSLENLLHDFLYQMEDMGLYAASISILSVMVELEIKKRSAETSAFRKLVRVIITYAERVRHVLVNAMTDDSSCTETEDEVILEYSTQKLQAFLLYLRREFMGKDSRDIKCIVFVQRRQTAKVLYHVIKRFVEATEGLNLAPQFMTGHNNNVCETIEVVLENARSRSILDDFRRNACNLIVASSVLEEGIDVQACNYVIMFDEIKTFLSYVQTKGRARSEKSTYGILIPSSKCLDIARKINNYKEMDQLMKNYLIGKTIDRFIPCAEETDRQFMDLIKPFLSPIGARLEADSALSLLNRYCCSLPSDTFTNVEPRFRKVERDATARGIIVGLTLPLQSTIKDEIFSDPMPSVRMAKKSAAFNAIKRLYENGEFNDHLLPVTEKQCLEMISPRYFKHWDQFSTDDRWKAGTRKNRRMYAIEYPRLLTAAFPRIGQTYYLNSIVITPKFVCDDENENIFKLLSTNVNYSILTNEPLPKLATMPLFMSQGMLHAQVVTKGVIKFETEAQLLSLRNFHVMVFRDILRIWKDFFAYDFRNGHNSFLIVPVVNHTEIQWDLVNNFQSLTECQEMTAFERAKLILKPEDFLGKVVATWYRLDEDLRFVVSKVHTDLTPFSPFPNNVHSSYADYVKDKYDVDTMQRNQFMIEVQPITQRLSYLTNADGIDGKRTRKSNRIDKIYLIPELCHNYKYPGDLWLKARFIPSILHRLHSLLLAENLRVKINSFLGVNSIGYVPKPLIVDRTLSRVGDYESSQSTKSMLPSLVPNTQQAKPVEHSESLIAKGQCNVEPYKKPQDIDRFLTSLFQVEVDYYFNFINDLVVDVQKMKLNHDEQFEVHKLPSATSAAPSTSTAAAILDIPMEERSKISILSIRPTKNESAEQWEFMAALTAAGANDVFDMERLEVLGDSFLKFSISLYLLRKHPTWNEGLLSSVKGKFVSNRNLLYLSMAMRIPGMLTTTQFSPRGDWQPPLLAVPKNALDLVNRQKVSSRVFYSLRLDYSEVVAGQCKEKTLNELSTHFGDESPDLMTSDLIGFTGMQVVSDKVCADAMEAILGVCLRNYGIERSFSMLEFMNICGAGENMPGLLKIDLGSPRIRTNISDAEVDDFLVNYKHLEENLGYTFKDRGYLLQALTHPSFPTNRLTGCYQQLEFIGDAILDFLVSCYIFENCMDMDPGKLTDLRSALVNNVTLACIAVRNKFHLFILHQNAALAQSISQFCSFQESQNFCVTDQVRQLRIEDEQNEQIADYIDVPKALGDIFEALIGAVFLDSGNDLKRTWDVIYKLMQYEINEFMANVPKQVVRQLFEFKGANPVFSDPIVSDGTCMVKCTFVCLNENRETYGIGKNKEQAKFSAAKLALQALFQL